MDIDWHALLGAQWSSLDTELGPPFERTRYLVWADVLDSARLGTLPSDWRDRVESDAYDAGTAERLAALEIVNTDRADWEPHAARGNWRAALTAWHAAQIHNENSYEVNHQHELAIAASDLRRCLSRMDSRLHRDLLRKELHRLTGQSTHRVRYVARRDFLDASYRAGLAAGGEANDWLGWYRSRVEQWAVDESPGHWQHRKARHLSAFNNPVPLQKILQRLPHYWTARP